MLAGRVKPNIQENAKIPFVGCSPGRYHPSWATLTAVRATMKITYISLFTAVTALALAVISLMRPSHVQRSDRQDQAAVTFAEPTRRDESQAVRENVDTVLQKIVGDLGVTGRTVSAAGAGPVAQDITCSNDTETIRCGNVEVALHTSYIGPVAVQEVFAKTATETVYFVVDVRIANTSETHKVAYMGWMSDRSSASVSDDFGNRFTCVGAGFFRSIVGNIRGADVYPRQTVFDRLVFDRPVAKSSILTLRLPGVNVGCEAELCFAIPTASISSFASLNN